MKVVTIAMDVILYYALSCSITVQVPVVFCALYIIISFNMATLELAYDYNAHFTDKKIDTEVQ